MTTSRKGKTVAEATCPAKTARVSLFTPPIASTWAVFIFSALVTFRYFFDEVAPPRKAVNLGQGGVKRRQE
jgi:hypothetical protein